MITGCVDNGNGTSTLTYSSISYKTGWNVTRLLEKTVEYRRTILFPNVRKLGYSYPVTGINEVGREITVSGDATPVYQYISSSTFAMIYGQYIRDNIGDRSAKFFDQTGTNSYADGDTTYDGVCEVCHTQTKHHLYDGTGSEHYGGDNCRGCHSHVNGFAHGSAGTGGDCEDCHGHEDDWPAGGPYAGTTTSHSTHTEDDSDDVKGPYMTCDGCHDTNNYRKFNDGKRLFLTNACDTCHSPSGSFDGVDSTGNSIGAKDNWADGVYQVDGTLTINKEKWCAGCHDNAPAVVDGNTAPDIVGDNSTYGFYLGAHGNGTYGVDHNSRSYIKGECVNCHASDNISASSSHGGQLFDTNNEDFCFKCHTDTSSYQAGGLVNRNYSYRAGGYADTLNDIQEAFSFTAPGTSHNLSDIINNQNELFKSLMATWGYTAESNPCSACHNPHLAIGDPASAPNSRKTSGTRGYSPVSRPSLHNTDIQAWGLWGGVASERMSANTYQAPYAATNYEPDGSAMTDGSNLVDYVTFCTDCHNESNNIYSTTLGRQLRTINWSNEKHGLGDGDATPALPYDIEPNYVLSCTDCHEPHGSPNTHLTRKGVNNGVVTVTGNPMDTRGTEWASLCERCHPRSDLEVPHHAEPIVNDCAACHPGNPTYTPCIFCHYHGSTFTGSGYTNYVIF